MSFKGHQTDSLIIVSKSDKNFQSLFFFELKTLLLQP